MKTTQNKIQSSNIHIFNLSAILIIALIVFSAYFAAYHFEPIANPTFKQLEDGRILSTGWSALYVPLHIVMAIFGLNLILHLFQFFKKLIKNQPKVTIDFNSEQIKIGTKNHNFNQIIPKSIVKGHLYGSEFYFKVKNQPEEYLFVSYSKKLETKLKKHFGQFIDLISTTSSKMDAFYNPKKSTGLDDDELEDVFETLNKYQNHFDNNSNIHINKNSTTKIINKKDLNNPENAQINEMINNLKNNGGSMNSSSFDTNSYQTTSTNIENVDNLSESEKQQLKKLLKKL